MTVAAAECGVGRGVTEGEGEGKDTIATESLG